MLQKWCCFFISGFTHQYSRSRPSAVTVPGSV